MLKESVQSLKVALEMSMELYGKESLQVAELLDYLGETYFRWSQYQISRYAIKTQLIALFCWSKNVYILLTKVWVSGVHCVTTVSCGILYIAQKRKVGTQGGKCRSPALHDSTQHCPKATSVVLCA